MKKGTELFIGSFAYPFLVAVLVPFFTLLWSKLATDSWLHYLLGIPKYIWLFFGGILFLWLTLIAVYKRVRKIRAENAGIGPVIAIARGSGYEEIGEQIYREVLWAIRIPAQPPWRLTHREAPSPSDIDIATPPRCPQCKTEIEERKTFWGKYLWTCPRCEWSKKNSESFYIERNRVEKIVRRDFRESFGHDKPGPGA